MITTSRQPVPAGEPETGGFEPVPVLQVEIGDALSDVPPRRTESGRPCRRAMTLVRLHTQPLGWIELQLGDNGLTTAEYARQVWQALRRQIAAHVHDDGLPEVSALSESGLPAERIPRCVQERDAYLSHAPFASIIVPTRDRPDHLALCLQSLLALEYPAFEIIVVDSVPRSAATLDLISTRFGAMAHVRYIREDRPGSAAARNRGLSIARSDIVAFTDDDVLVDKYWLAQMAKAFDIAPDVACVTGLVLPLELETPAQVWFEQYGGFSKGFTRQIFDMREHRPRHPTYPYSAGNFGSGNSMAFKKSVLQELGNFDPMLGNGTPTLGGVDIEAFFRVVISGYKLVYEPAAIVHHRHRRDTGQLRKQIYSYGVGFSAVLTRCLLANPRLIFDFASRVPTGLRMALRPKAAIEIYKWTAYPRELSQLEPLGMLYGPLAYLRSWWWWKVTVPRRHQ